jgi:hypothetical protein
VAIARPRNAVSAVVLSVIITLGVHAELASAPPEVDHLSLMTTPVFLLNGGDFQSQATGFFYGRLGPGGGIDAVFLVTNYHVVTGHKPGKDVPKSGDRLRFYMHLDASDPSSFVTSEIPLYTSDGNPTWIASAETPDADIVLIPLSPKLYEKAHLFLFTEEHTRSNFKVRPGTPAVLIGYPYGFSDFRNFLPIWRTGHVATEPETDFDGKPTFLVDAAVFPGMSGSPVAAVANGTYETEDGASASGRVVKLLGVFSSNRLAPGNGESVSGPVPDATSLQLGLVWKASVLVNVSRHFDARNWQSPGWSRMP